MEREQFVSPKMTSQFKQDLLDLTSPSVAGDGWSSRAGDSILNGCIPVVIMDDVDAVFETILQWQTFSIRVPEVSHGY